MRYTIYTDKDGYIRRSLVKDTDGDDKAPYGIPAGPPDLRQLDMAKLVRDMSNALAENEIWDVQSLQRSQIGVTVATNVIRRALILLYREEAINQ